MGTAIRFRDWNAERDSRQAVTDEASYEKKISMTQEYLTPDIRVVEIGNQERSLQHHLAVLLPCLTALARRDPETDALCVSSRLAIKKEEKSTYA